MPRFRLRLSEPPTVTASNCDGVFHWLPDRNSTIYGALHNGPHLGPNLGALGAALGPNIDFARIAVAVYAADRSAARAGGGSNWNQREIRLKIALRDPDRWAPLADELKAVIDLLTGDDWEFAFTRTRGSGESQPTIEARHSRVVLLSGGADSATGGLLSRAELAPRKETQALVSHYTSSVLSPLQRDIFERVQSLATGPADQHIQVHLTRRGSQLDGKSFRDETSTRARSLLFIALGVAVASIHEVPLWIPENGFASINPPLGLDRLGSLSTRTTHPAFLSGLRDLLGRVGAHADIINPYARATKGEMFAEVAKLLGPDRASKFLSATNSCAHTGQRSFRISAAVPCGVCFGCVVRRASFAAAGLKDRTTYISASGDARLRDWLEVNSVARPIRRLTERGISQTDLIAIGLPDDYPLAEADELCRRGLQELAGFVG